MYGQITDITEPKKSANDPDKWNLHFILGMDGHLMQCWIFSTETKIKERSNSLEERNTISSASGEILL